MRFIKMIGQRSETKQAVVIIPEIYGMNQYIYDWVDFFRERNFDSFCVDLSQKERVYQYTHNCEAYQAFIDKNGFMTYQEIEIDMLELRKDYNKVIVFGSSVGATVAWRLTENPNCDGMIGFYGSRIRDYLDVSPVCPCLLIFPEQETSFEVRSIIPRLNQKDKVDVHVLAGCHGFADRYGDYYCEQSANRGLDMVNYFLRKID
ncbi:dienelactone hydrolase family protein [Acetobacterium wieringae]|uniref:dienelactone hydrolase family protein n=1 Tax=Acetobacterium wieringae TaxID=52694 RepID=UPI0026EC044C|nr:dienelactone hydrolase family protein [Acetobacterium wieringae]